MISKNKYSTDNLMAKFLEQVLQDLATITTGLIVSPPCPTCATALQCTLNPIVKL